MKEHMKGLTDLQHDAITEIFNISVGRAGDTLSRMVHEPVQLNVPEILVSRRAEALQRFHGDTERAVCAVIQRFSGPFTTDAMLMFPEQKSLELVRLFIGEEMPLEQMTDMEQEAMAEIGNIILNSCVGAMANLFRTEFQGGLPRVRVGAMADILAISHLDQHPEVSGDDFVLLLFIQFAIEKRAIEGYVAFVLDLPSFEELAVQVDRFISRIPG
jgi:chemotaxis protein CheC